MGNLSEVLHDPLVSVVVPTYNCARYIVQALESVLAQSYRHFEIIVVDGSTDDTRSVLKAYRDKILYLYQPNQGVVAARNLGIERARGTLIAFLDADDMWYPEKLRLQVQAVQTYPDAGLCFTNHQGFDPTGVFQEPYEDARLSGWIKTHQVSNDVAYGAIYRELLIFNCMNTSSVILRREILDRIGLFDEAFKICEDHDLWIRVAQEYPVVCVNRVLCAYRCRPDGLSGSTTVREFRWHLYSVEVLEKHLRNNRIPDDFRAIVKNGVSQRCWNVGWNYFSQNSFKEARRFFLRGLRHRPSHYALWLFWAASFLPLPVIAAIRRIKRARAEQETGLVSI